MTNWIWSKKKLINGGGGMFPPSPWYSRRCGCWSLRVVAMGLALGVFVSQQQAVPTEITPTVPNPAFMSTIPANGTVSNLRIVNADTATGNVELAGEVVQPLRLSGGMEDETVRGLLFSALQDASNAGGGCEPLKCSPGNRKMRRLRKF